MSTDAMQSVFVLMPFDEDFQLVYDHFLRPRLEEVGFKVSRADDIQSQQNILRDIIKGIAESNLIVADLTNANPNVFYELGIAHAFGKPVLLVTQSIEDVPFDLKSYRLVEYSTHFVKIETAIESLRHYGKEFLEGKVPFGNPVSDFYPSAIREIRSRAIAQQRVIGEETSAPESVGAVEQDGINELDPQMAGSQKEADDRGFFDHLVAINEGYTAIGKIMEGVTKDLMEVTNSIEIAGKDINSITSTPSSSSATAAQNVGRRLATRLGTFNNKLVVANAEYIGVTLGMENSLEFIISFSNEIPGPRTREFDQSISLLRDVRATAEEARDSFNVLANIMDALPRIERRLNREVSRGSEQIRIMAGNMDRTISSITRALNLIE